MARREFSEVQRAAYAAGQREQLEEWQSRLTDKIADLVDGDQWRRWLDVAAKFHDYSFRNTLLILLQRPDATAVAGYRAWQSSFGRQVNRGETAIRVFAPITKQSEETTAAGKPVLDEQGRPVKTRQVVGFRLVPVFDVSQTHGPALPEQPVPTLLTGQAPPGLWEGLQQFIEAQGYRITRGDCGGANGTTFFPTALSRGEVRVRDDIDDAAAVKTLAHEAGHVLLHAPQARVGEDVCRGRWEVEAESVAYLVTKAHGLDSSQYTFNYVAGWAEQAAQQTPDAELVDIVAQTGARVVKAADTILTVTKPASLIRQVSERAIAGVERAIEVDRANELVAHTATKTVAPTRRPEPPAARTPTVGAVPR